jgi:heat-inducible transcriptional repressor
MIYRILISLVCCVNIKHDSILNKNVRSRYAGLDEIIQTMETGQLPALTPRQEKILAFIVRAYTQSPEPVSSKQVVEESDLNVSSATIRNEMAILGDLGYIVAPHTSAGRIPTANGYRYFVSNLLNIGTQTGALIDSEMTHITVKFQVLPLITEQWLRVSANVLARTTQAAALVAAPIAETSRFKHLELVSVQGRLALMVLVLHGGVVQQRMLNLAEPVPQSRLAEVASQINNLCADLYAHQIRMKSVQLGWLEREVAELAVEVMEHADTSASRLVYRDGLVDVIRSFQDGEGAQQVVRAFEERAFIDMILSEFIDPIVDDVQVIVGGDGKWDEVSQLSMVLSQYGVPGKMTGAIGLLGPTHLNYGRAISAVRHVSTLMTNMLIELYDSNNGVDDDKA